VTGTEIRRRGRGKAQKSLALIEAAAEFLETAHPTTVRGICYRLFVDGVIPSMARKDTSRVRRLLRDAREDDIIPWEWIVDETRQLERVPSWNNPTEYVRVVRHSYRRDFWAHQPDHVEVWSEKGTVRGVLNPVLEEYGVGFRVMHGFGSATSVYDVAQELDGDGQSLIALYVGDWDPSGLYMSEKDLPERLSRYGGDHVIVDRVALVSEDIADPTLPSFAASDKRRDPRYAWFIDHHADRCWELDAMHPNTLRARVRDSILDQIEPEAWARCERAQQAEQGSLERLLDNWSALQDEVS
jgi:hypothetical protein